MDPTTTELLKQCDTVEDFAAQIDVLAGLRLRSAIPAVLAMLGVRV